eukprot:CAMPEP_0119009600 /NCGR_PEP_ID=MMETSP1176-20130426/4479_1 /TAXON_ID=265551 /ORGANISM="Synedropsis recta cf, Strain CCMP1620" /LENGTH=115 /DNA_ID=CAMNT_0006962143 /DNA_START=231 /DNA_END=574 /DNA_ORIENTATION=+
MDTLIRRYVSGKLVTTYYVRNTKLNVIIAIEPGDPRLPAEDEGSVEKPRKWIQLFRFNGCNKERFVAFCEMMCSDIPVENNRVAGDLDDDRKVIWENLSDNIQRGCSTSVPTHRR